MKLTLGVTGHRPDKLGGFGNLEAAIRLEEIAFEYLRAANPGEVLIGMALGFDTACARACIRLGIPFVAAVPCAGQERLWPQLAREEHARLLRHAAATVVVSPGGYSDDKMQIRNEWIVDNCDRLTAMWNGSTGGTANCVEYAISTGRQLKNLWERWSGPWQSDLQF